MLNLIPVLAAAAVAAPPPEIAWYVLTADDGAIVGYAFREAAGGAITESQEVVLRDQHGPPVRSTVRTVTETGASGRATSISSLTRTGKSWSRVEARIAADYATVARQTPAGLWTTQIELPREVRFDAGEGLLAGWDPVRTPKLEFTVFDASDMAVERMVIEPAPGAVRDAKGLLPVIRRTYDGTQLLAVARLWIDRGGHIQAAAQSMFGATVTSTATDKASALKPHDPYRALPAVMTRSPYVITSPQTRSHIRYRFSFKDGLALDLPATSDQHTSQEPGRTVLDVCEGCGPGLPTDAGSLAEARRPAIWLQSDDARIQAIAAPIARLAVSDTRKMELLAARTTAFLPKLDFTGHYSAVETIERRSGDCTEAAALLAALGRAAGIPTKVADGLVYSRETYHGVANVFMPHSWVLAYVDGRWKSFDAALGGFDATHVALVIGDGDAKSLVAAGQLAGLLTWEGMAEVRARPAS